MMTILTHESRQAPSGHGAALQQETPMTPDDVVARIDPDEVVELALALGNIDSPTGSEGAAGGSSATG